MSLKKFQEQYPNIPVDGDWSESGHYYNLFYRVHQLCKFRNSEMPSFFMKIQVDLIRQRLDEIEKLIDS